MFRIWLCIVSVLVTLNAGKTFSQVNPDDEELLIGKASRAFERSEYDEALPMYSQIVSNHPNDPMYNYRLGVCMLKAGSDKTGAVRFLRTAVKSTHVPINAWMYLGMALHHAAKYEEAVAAFETFRDGAGKQPWKDLEGDKWLRMSRNAISAQEQASEVQHHSIVETYHAPRSEFFKPYAAMTGYGRFLAMPDEYSRFIIKGRQESSWVFLGSDGKTMLFSGKGSQGNDYDIFIVHRKSGNQWSAPEEIRAINTADDEAYPVISQDGKFIFFSSKGNGSTGGYDIFKSSFNSGTLSWSAPVSMGSQVNSPGDDFGYVPSGDGSEAYFASDRESAPGQCQVFKARIRANEEGMVHVTGTFVCSQALDNSEARVTILRQSDRSLVRELRQHAAFSTYTIEVASGSKLIYKIDLPGFRISEQVVDFGPFDGGTLMEVIAISRGKDGADKAIISHMRPNPEPDGLTATVPQSQNVRGDHDVQKTNQTDPEMKSGSTVVQPEAPKPDAANETRMDQKQALALESPGKHSNNPKAANKEEARVEQKSSLTDPGTQTDAPSSSEYPVAASIANHDIQNNHVESGNGNPASDSSNETTPPINGDKQLPSGDVQIRRSEKRVAELLPVASHGQAVSAEAIKVSEIARINDQEKPRNPVPVPPKVQKEPVTPVPLSGFGDVIFRVQVGAYRDKTPDQLKKKFSPSGLTDLVYVQNDQGMWLVMTGSTKDYTEAVRLKETVISKGVTDAFIVAYSNGKRLPVNLVVMLEEEEQ